MTEDTSHDAAAVLETLKEKPATAPTGAPAGRGESERGGRPTVRRARSATTLDTITALALQRVREAHPHARLLALTGWTMAELAKRVEPPVSRSRLADVFAQAEAYGRMSQAWADRLARAVGVDATAVLELFGVAEPSRNGRPRVRRSA